LSRGGIEESVEGRDRTGTDGGGDDADRNPSLLASFFRGSRQTGKTNPQARSGPRIAGLKGGRALH
jgi:hypothetical protein